MPNTSVHRKAPRRRRRAGTECGGTIGCTGPAARARSRASRRFWRSSSGAEDGQTLLLGIGMMAVVLALVFVIASASAVYLDVKNLTAAADSAAAAAADAVDNPSYFGGAVTSGGPGRLTDSGILLAAVDDLSAHPDPLPGMRISAASTPDGQTALVTLTAHSQPPFLPWGIIPADGFTITATGSARVSTTG